jgi:hypothetical protein
MLRLWNRLVSFEESRLENKFYFWDWKQCNSEVKTIMETINMSENFVNRTQINLKIAETILDSKASISWKNELYTKTKLRTYITFKENFKTENYVEFCKNRLQRSLLAQLRTGTLPLNIEVGRFRNIELENRKCTLCNVNVVENEYHFVCECPMYDDCRSTMSNNISNKHPEFDMLCTQDKFIFLVKNEWQILSRYLQSAWEIRTNELFSNS